MSDPRSSFRVGVAIFSPEFLSSENLYLSASYPLLIHEALGRIETHTYTQEEAAAYSRTIVAKEREKLLRQRDEALVRGDSSYLSGDSSGKQAGGSQVAELTGKIQRLDSLDLREIAIQTEKQVVLVTGRDGPLLPQVIGPPAETAEEFNLDLLIFGRIEEIQSYLFVDVRSYSAAFGEMERLRTGFSRERITGASEQIFDSLIRTVLGREWAGVTVTASVDSAEIYVDGEFQGTGEITLDYLEPGEHRIEVSAFGHRDYSETVFLSPGKDVEMTAVLTEADQSTISITSIPEGADLYARSLWYGSTPTEIPGDFLNLQGMLRSEGYQDFLLPVIPEGTDSLDIRLLPRVFDRRTVIEHERDGFYKVLAAFILSLPLPVFFFDATNTLTQAYAAEAQRSPIEINIDEAYKILELRQITLGAYIATAFVSAVLFVDATLELLEYIDRVQLSTY